MPKEETIWESRPSQLLNFQYFFIAGLLMVLLGRFLHPAFAILPFLFGLYKYYQINSISYTLSTQRLIIKYGVLIRKTTEIELYRILDYSVKQTIWQRMFEVYDVILTSSDRSHETMVLESIKRGEEIKDKIRYNVEHGHRDRVVREVEVQ